MQEREGHQISKASTTLGAPSLGVIAFCFWILMGACFSLGFAVAEPAFRMVLVPVVLVWAVLGPFAMSYFFVDLSTILSNFGGHEMALKVARLGIAVDESITPLIHLFGIHESPLVVLNLMNEGHALMRLNRFQEACARFELAVDKAQAALGWEHNLTQIVVGQHAGALLCIGKFNQAEACFKRSIAATAVKLENLDDDDDPDEEFQIVLVLALDRFGLGSLFLKESKFVQAEAQFEQAIKLLEERVEEDTDVLADNLNALGELYVRTGRLDEARVLLERALRIRQQIFPRTHIAIACSYQAFGYLYLEQKNFYDAKRYLADAGKLKLDFLGEQHPEVAELYRAQGELELELRNAAKAEELLNKALKILSEKFESHPELACVLDSLAALHSSVGNDSEADLCQVRAVEIRRLLNNGFSA